MKNLLYLFLLGVLFSCAGSGENEEVNPEEPDGKPKEYVVSLGMVGEIEISESPLGRASSNDLYGIQVYSKTATTEYAPYAYGLFDDKSKMTIKLLEGYNYKFVTTMVVNGKNVIEYVNSLEVYYYPFIVNSGFIKLTNSFLFDNKNELYVIDQGEAYLSGYTYDQGKFKCPNIDRYYGELANYTPSEKGVVSINMKRVVFGVKFVAEGLIEGYLKINIKDAPELNIVHGVSSEIEDVFTFKNTYPSGLAWTADDYSETIPVSISWEKADGAIVPLVNQDITFKRKILTTITIKVKDTSINNGVEISQEPGDLTPGDNITLESGTGVENPVEPNI